LKGPKRKRFGEMLVEYGLVEPEKLEEALEIQNKTGEKLGKVLKDMGAVSKQELIEILGIQLGMPQVNLHRYIIDPIAVKSIPESLAKRLKAVPVKKEEDHLVVAMSNPLDIFAIDDIRLTSGLNVKPVLADEEDILSVINQYYTMKESIEQVIDELAAGEDEGVEVAVENELEASERAPVVKLVNSIIQQGIRDRASDIHIEPGEDIVKIRYRIDGVLHGTMKYPKHLHNAVIARIKIISDMDITIKRLPQDGRKKFEFDKVNVDLRISTLPTVHGEKIAIRILDRDKYFLKLENLGFTSENLLEFREIINYPYGMILVSGPTGSGKTTTLYSTLHELDFVGKNIVTIEDPVEYMLGGINQVQVQPKIGLTFAEGLRSILRQDPNIIMVGEIRDSETADIAIRAALTGHLVLSTIHTNDSASAITRLIDMGVEPFLIASSVIGVVAQRLVRKICPECRREYQADDKELLSLGISGPRKLYKGAGCSFCNNTGYKGRVAIYEMLRLLKEHRSLIIGKASSDTIKEISVKNGMKTLKESGVDLVLKGITTTDEILKATTVDN
jgi:type IV pilus assembly protein PilB